MSEFREGLSGPFYGAQAGRFKIGPLVYEAVEDEDDGYRSMMSDVVLSADQSTSGFFPAPIAHVRVEELDDDLEVGGPTDGYQLVDEADGHIWLRMGTAAYDDYYPMYIFEYVPKPPILGTIPGTDDDGGKP